jgi:acetyl esterase/lipase
VPRPRSQGQNNPRFDLQPALADVVYRVDDGLPIRLDVYKPTGPAPEGGWPVVMAIHGGGWHRYDKSGYGQEIAPLTRYGYVVVAMNYKLSAPFLPSWPTNFEEIRDSVRWVRRNAEMLEIDPDRIAALGESAGGHLAALLGVYPDGPVSEERPPANEASGPTDDVSARVQEVVDIAGPSDLLQLAIDLPKDAGYWAEQYLNRIPADDPERFAAASPLSLVSSDDPPTLIIHGGSDTFIPPSQSSSLADALTAAGVPNQLVILPGIKHQPRGLSLGSRNLLPFILPFLSADL